MEPLPSSLSTSIEPPCISTIHFAMDRPSPAPPCSRERALSALQNRSKMWARSCFAIPIPVSDAATIAKAVSVSSVTFTEPLPGVYFTALSIRVNNARRRASPSARIGTGPPGKLAVNSRRARSMKARFISNGTLFLKQANPTLLTWGHELDEQGVPSPSRVFPYNRMHSPSSNLHSNVLDMARWAIANLNRGESEGRRILQASTYDIMWTPARPGGPAEDGQAGTVG